jgi:hypothetical protein
MSNLSSNVNDIYFKVEKLILLHEQLTVENKKLKQANDNLTQRLQLQKEDLGQLEHKNKILKLSKLFTESDNTHDLKLKINEFIREIDKSIALLNS